MSSWEDFNRYHSWGRSEEEKAIQGIGTENMRFNDSYEAWEFNTANAFKMTA
jgi:hypothetical protein